MSLNVDHIRKMNKVSLLKGGSQDAVFTAYCNGPLEIETSANITDPFGSNSGMGLTSFDAVVNMLDTVPAIDVPRKFLYRGTKPITLDVPCYLILNDFSENEIVALAGDHDAAVQAIVTNHYITPIQNLLRIFLPSRGTNLSKKVQGGIDMVNNVVSSLLSMFNTNSVSFSSQSDISDYLGQIYTLNLPDAFKPYKGDNQGLNLKWGCFFLEEVIVTGMGMRIPRLMYEGGYPDHIALSIRVETLRCATTNTIPKMIKGKSNADGLDAKDMTGNTSQIIKLL